MLNCIDLFSGCGGLTEGFKSSGSYDLLAAVEWEKDALDTLRHRLEKKYHYKDAVSRCLMFDIQKTQELISGDEGFDELVGNRKVHVVIGGPPCQAYSIAGRIRDEKGMHEDYRNYLFESYMEVVKHFKPDACIFENVTGMLSAAPGGVSIVERVRASFNLAGYTISENLKDEAVFDVSNYGIPQRRKRVIIAAFRNEKFKEPKKQVELFYAEMEKEKEKGVVTVKSALSGLPKIYPLVDPLPRVSHEVASGSRSVKVTDHIPRFHNKRDVEIFRLLTQDIESGKEKYITADALKDLYTVKTGKVSSVHKYHVLRRDKPSNTIPAHLYKDGLRHIHPDSAQSRTITVREAARLQSFPDDFEFLGSSGSKYKMIGNAVPPVFSLKIAKALERSLSKT